MLRKQRTVSTGLAWGVAMLGALGAVGALTVVALSGMRWLKLVLGALGG